MIAPAVLKNWQLIELTSDVLCLRVNFKGQFNRLYVVQVILESEDSLVKVKFLLADPAAKYLSQFLIAINQISAVCILQPV